MSSYHHILDSVTSLPTPYIFALPLLFLLPYAIYQIYISPLSAVPGPFTASLSRLWITQQSWAGATHRTMISLHSKHGSLVRTAPNEVSISSLSAIKKIYGAGTKFRKSDWYSVWQGRRKFDLFAGRDEKIHGEQRRLVSSAYSMSSLKDLEVYVDASVEVFLERMREMVGKSVDMGLWVQLFAFDVIGEITFSRRFGFMDTGVDDGSMSAIESALKSASWIGQVPWLFWLHDYLSPIIGNHLGITNRHGSLRTFAAKEITARKDRGTDRKDILSRLFKVQDEKPGQFDDNGVISMATSNIFAGSDTTAISTRAIIYYLLKNPDSLAKLRSEIDTLYVAGQISSPVRLEEADKMPYLQAVMYEALRLHPAVGMSLPRVVPDGGFEIDDVFLPAGTIVGVNPWVVHRNKEVFGEDAEAFRPERWMGEDVGDMHRFFFAFGAGARMCLGRNISWMEMSKLIPTLLLHFDIELTDPEAGWIETCWWFVMQQDINVILREREKFEG